MFLAALLFTVDLNALLSSPVVAMLLLGLFGLAITALHHVFAKLRADGQARGGLLGKIEVGAADIGDAAAELAAADKQNVVALADPAKRADAVKALEKDAEAAVASKLKEGL